MAANSSNRLPKILKINRIDKKNLRISVLFSTGEDRVIDFLKIIKNEWKVSKKNPEHILLDPDEFAKVKIVEHTLSWNNVALFITGLDGRRRKVPFDIGADTLYKLSTADEKLGVPIGSLLRKARLASNLSQEKVAELSGTSRTYITRLESGKQDVEIGTLKKIVEAGLAKHLMISIE